MAHQVHFFGSSAPLNAEVESSSTGFVFHFVNSPIVQLQGIFVRSGVYIRCNDASSSSISLILDKQLVYYPLSYVVTTGTPPICVGLVLLNAVLLAL